MAAKKKSPSTAARSGKAGAAAPEAVVPAAEVTAASVPAVTNTPAAKAAPKADVVVASAPTASAERATVSAESAASLPGLEADVRPMIQMPAPPQDTSAHAVPHDVIARRAHEIHRLRGGSAFDNWLQAERELAGR